MAEFKIMVHGNLELSNAFKNLDDKIQRAELLKIQRKAARRIERTAINLTPKNTGKLAKTVKIFTGESKEFAIVAVGHAAGRKANPDGFYGFWVHEGLGGRTEGQGHKASKHLTKAFESQESAVEGAIMRDIKILIDQVF